MISVVPRSLFSRSRALMISLPTFESRLPVGSSAMMMAGSFTMARAMATRCCCPPESSVGRWWTRSARPTVSRASTGTLRSMSIGGARIAERQLHIRERAVPGEQVEGLEDEAHLVIPDAGQLIVAQRGDEDAVQIVLARGWAIEAAQDVHQGRLAGSGGAHDGDHLAARDRQRGAATAPATSTSPIL